MKQRLVIFKFTVLLICFSSFSYAGSLSKSFHELSPDIFAEVVNSPDNPKSRLNYFQKQVIQYNTTNKKSQLDYTGNAFERNALYLGGANIRENLSLRSIHKYSGYATLGAVLITSVSKSSPSFHCKASKGATYLASITVLSGIVRYGFPKIERSNILSSSMLHRLMGTAGLIGCAASVYLAEHNGVSSHSGLGIGGAGLMALSVAIIKW